MLIGYKCKVCGAPIDPDTGYCHYCDTLNFKPIKKDVKTEKPQIIVRNDVGEEVIKPMSLSLEMINDEILEVTALEDTTRRFIKLMQHASFDITSILTDKTVDILNKHIFDVVFTGFKHGYCHNFKAYVSDFYIDCFQSTRYLLSHFKITSVNPVDMWNIQKIKIPMLEGARCPICGAVLDVEKSKCDYCGYWWRFVPEGNRCLGDFK